MKTTAALFISILFCIDSLAQINFNKPGLDSFFQVFDAANKLYGSVAIVKNGRIIYESVLGKYNADKTGAYPMKLDHPKLRIGSITKSVTAVLIMQLVEEKKLLLNSKLSEWFPQIPKADSITIEQLLTHRSGVHSFDKDINENNFNDWSYQPQTKEYLLQKLAGYPPDFSPGTKEAYSNAGYLLLGYIIERITQKGYREVLKDKIATPLQLYHMYYTETIDTARGEVFSYVKESGWKKWPAAHLSLAGAAGSIVSTAANICQFYDAVFSGKLINKGSLDFLKGTGTGLNRQADFGGFYGTTGRIDKYFANVAYFIKDSVTIAVFLNGADYPFGQVFFKMAAIYYGEPTDMPDFTPVSQPYDSLKQYCGSYRMRNGTIITIETRKSHLFFMLKAEGYGALLLTVLKNGWMINEEKGIILNFGRDEKGLVNRFTMFQANQTIRTEKVK
jgi:D-alanyl-D-alanine carboxypeptidase